MSSYDIIEYLWDSNDNEEYDIYGPYHAAGSEFLSEGQCHFEEWRAYAYEEALKTNPELEDYERIIISLPWPDAGGSHINGCQWGGLGQVGGRYNWVNVSHAGVITHELQHNLGIGHLVDFKFDPTDYFGSRNRMTGFNTPHLDMLGLLPGSSVVEISRQEPQNYLLLSSAIDPWDYPGHRLIKITVPGDWVYYISFRGAAVGMNTYLESEYTFAVYIHRKHDFEEPLRVDPLDIIKNGETFIPTNGSFSVEVTDVSEGGQSWEAQITVTFFPTGVLGYNWRAN
jgi:hypothetical protein